MAIPMEEKDYSHLIERIGAHTIAKFEIVEEYVKSWAQKLLQTAGCKGLIFIDCMCNCGLYRDSNDQIVFGTPIRVAKVLREAAGQYPNKHIYLFLNDYDTEKIECLKTKLPNEKGNFHVKTSVKDGNELLNELSPTIHSRACNGYHTFVFYDPFDASIDWDALEPYFFTWGELLINHNVQDPVRAVSQTTRPSTMKKYEGTYRQTFEEIRPYGTNKDAYENRVHEIVASLSGAESREYYVASFPFFNSNNSLQYELIHCTGNLAGYKLYKATAWKKFGGRSSLKTSRAGKNEQYALDFDNLDNEVGIKAYSDSNCFTVADIARYLQAGFEGQINVPLEKVWGLLDLHPVFPSDGLKNEIKDCLKKIYGATIGKRTISFSKGKNWI